MAQTDAQVRADLAAAISAVATDSVVFDYWPLGFQIAEWPAMLRSLADSDKVRAWVMTRRSIVTERLPGSLSRKISTYAIWFFHYFHAGDDTVPGGDSEDSFSAELDAVINALSGEGRGEGLQVPIIDILPFGAELLHVAQCEIVVTVC